MVPTDVVRVSEPAMCTLRLSVRVFIPLPNGGEKTQNPGFDILNLGSRKFWKFSKTRSCIKTRCEGGGECFYIRLWCNGCGGKGMQSDRHSFPMLCGDQVLVCTFDWCENRGSFFPAMSQTDRRNELIYMIRALVI
jgi:hypothetical protein